MVDCVPPPWEHRGGKRGIFIFNYIFIYLPQFQQKPETNKLWRMPIIKYTNIWKRNREKLGGQGESDKEYRQREINS